MCRRLSTKGVPGVLPSMSAICKENLGYQKKKKTPKNWPQIRTTKTLQFFASEAKSRKRALEGKTGLKSRRGKNATQNGNGTALREEKKGGRCLLARETAAIKKGGTRKPMPKMRLLCTVIFAWEGGRPSIAGDEHHRGDGF